MPSMREGFADFKTFVEKSVEEKKYQLGSYHGETIERPYYRPGDPNNLLEGITNPNVTVLEARMGRMMYDTIRARQRANALYERKREDYYLLAARNAESDINHLEKSLSVYRTIILGERE